MPNHTHAQTHTHKAVAPLLFYDLRTLSGHCIRRDIWQFLGKWLRYTIVPICMHSRVCLYVCVRERMCVYPPPNKNHVFFFFPFLRLHALSLLSVRWAHDCVQSTPKSICMRRCIWVAVCVWVWVWVCVCVWVYGGRDWDCTLLLMFY